MRENLDPILTDPDFLALPPEQDFLSQFRTMDTVPEEEAQWLVPGYIPQGQITLLAADGGVGKTSFWCQLLAALSTGRATLLEEVSPKWDSDSLSGKTDTPAETLSAKQDTPHKERWGAFFSTEDSVRKKLKKKLRLAGAKMMNLITLESSSTALLELRLGSPELSDFIHSYRPALCVLDPIQGFLPHGVNMAARNEIRECLAPLMALGEQVGTAFLLVCHTNKRAGAWGRTRLADSADLWDAARSVLMMGDAGDGRRYLSPETCRVFTTTLSRTSRRGLGFDKPDSRNPRRSPCCEEAPASVYGPTGFTGTCAWVDPDHRLVYVFLSNRVFPDVWNNKLSRLDIRTRIQQAIYKAIGLE